MSKNREHYTPKWHLPLMLLAGFAQFVLGAAAAGRKQQVGPEENLPNFPRGLSGDLVPVCGALVTARPDYPNWMESLLRTTDVQPMVLIPGPVEGLDRIYSYKHDSCKVQVEYRQLQGAAEEAKAGSLALRVFTRERDCGLEVRKTPDGMEVSAIPKLDLNKDLSGSGTFFDATPGEMEKLCPHKFSKGPNGENLLSVFPPRTGSATADGVAEVGKEWQQHVTAARNGRGDERAA